MSAFHGPQRKDAMRDHRETKRLKAEERNFRTPAARKRKARRAPATKEPK